MPSLWEDRLIGVDHLAIAVDDLEAAARFYADVLGFEEVERRETQGTQTGMRSVVMRGGPLKVVLLEGTSPESQVSRYVEHYGPGVQHAALHVRGIEGVVEGLKSRGLEFDTGVIHAPGLKQAFSKRDPVSGMMYELIERTGEEGFLDQNVSQLFKELEKKGSF